jgi:hypothetical protein
VIAVPQSPSAGRPSYSAVSISDVKDAREVWNQLVDSCRDAWFWHTWANLQFNLVAAEKYQAQNLSFFVFRDGTPVGLVPLMVSRVQIGGVSAWEASYYGGPVPWPAFLPDLPDLEDADDFALRELESRARASKAERIRLRLEPAFPMPEEQHRLSRAVNGLRYLDSSYVSHCVNLDGNTLPNIRERYRRYVKKFAPSYELSFVDCDSVTPELEEAYFILHVKDAGGQFRSRESYSRQADLTRHGEGFFVIARNRSLNVIAGMLLVSVYKGAAYDNSVAVDPDFQGEYVSHLLKWKAIEELLQRGARTYELGPKSELPSFMSVPSEKNLGISHFKEGWARASPRKVVMAEKFLSAHLLHAFMKIQADSLQRFFDLE